MEKVISLVPTLGNVSGRTTTTKSTGLVTRKRRTEKMTSMKNNVPDSVKKFLSEIGRKGGCATTELKASTARLNGMKGGRPKKVIE